MQTTPQTPTARAALNRDGARLFAGIAFYVALQAAVLFLAAGTLRWPAAWAYLGVYVLCNGSALAWAAAVNPAALNERGRRGEVESFDRRFHRLMPLLVFGGLAVAGLDERLGWSAVPPALAVVGLVLVAVALGLAAWVLATNAYAARVVRLQEGQRVVRHGPYRLVRHPMYTGTLLAFIGTALALGSWWGLLPAAAGIVLFVWRTAREDALLQGQLAGYADYANETRYRLLPGIW